MTKHKQITAREEIVNKRKQVMIDQLRMSVGELMNLYENDEINLSPDYQRLFRWSEQQQSDFIESILLGYPIPPIFVYQDENGKWDVVDGVQRLSTIYKFTNLLEPEKPQFRLLEGRILKKLEGLTWSGENSLDPSTKLDFRRSGLNIITILDKNETNPTYEIFRRLNTGGSKLSFQEIRNLLIIMSNKDIFDKLDKYCEESEVYSNLLSLSANKEILGFKMEVLSRYLILMNFDNCDLAPLLKENKSNIERFMDLAIEKIIKSNIDINSLITTFDNLVKFLSTYVDYDFNFRIYDNSKTPPKFTLGFNWLVFETIIWGLCVDNDLNTISTSKYNAIVESIKSIVSAKEFNAKNGTTNMKSTERMLRSRDYAKEVFSCINE